MANHYSLISLLLGQFFNTAVQFQIEKEQFNFTIQTIHSKRRFCSTQEESDGLEDVINHINVQNYDSRIGFVRRCYFQFTRLLFMMAICFGNSKNDRQN
ncbi:hypothetical protein L5515_015732 [Caenorhabditis briggsae]|uniref:Uncharacterized protein n=1 Tax=Caenorhabditis briggsae TaxID=6238 RepID=A0AAE9EEW7_CAEBR|nr:hypothetical protein L5515_015732 [Caenorhabditis briggsae]